MDNANVTCLLALSALLDEFIVHSLKYHGPEQGILIVGRDFPKTRLRVDFVGRQGQKCTH